MKAASTKQNQDACEEGGKVAPEVQKKGKRKRRVKMPREGDEIVMTHVDDKGKEQ